MMNEPLSSIMTTKLLTAGPNDSLNVVRQILLKHRIHHVPVVEDKKLVGLVTTYDLFKLSFHPDETDNIKVREIMTRKLATLEPHDKIGSAAEIFLEHLFHAVPIVKNGELVGIVTSFDVMKYEFKKAYPRHFASAK
ncbi:MAG TPA: CBS domain-containing protein [Saprospiraceae bacterium]|nr:CBS domain-containing protein [Saprospiraceae bacterium]